MLDIEQNRRARKYSSGEMIRRVLFTLMQPFFGLVQGLVSAGDVFFCAALEQSSAAMSTFIRRR